MIAKSFYASTMPSEWTVNEQVGLQNLFKGPGVYPSLDFPQLYYVISPVYGWNHRYCQGSPHTNPKTLEKTSDRSKILDPVEAG